MELFIFLLLIGKILSQNLPTDRYVISLTGPKAIPSSYLNSIPVFIGGVGVKYELSPVVIGVNKNYRTKVSIPLVNGDIASDLGSISRLTFNKSPLSFQKYYMNYNFASNKIYNDKHSTNFDENNDEYQASCKMYSEDVSFKTSYYNNEADSYVSYSYAGFGIKENKPVYIYVSNNTISNEPLLNYVNPSDRYILDNNLFDKIYLINEPYDDDTLLAFKIKSTSQFFFYKLDLLANNPNETNSKVSLTYYTNIEFNSTQYNFFSKIGKFKNDFLFGTDLGLIIMQKDTLKEGTNEFNPFMTFNYYLNNSVSVQDFIVNQRTIYIIAKELGFIILDPNRAYEIVETSFLHPYILKIDFINNPFVGNKFVGLQIDNKYGVNEFFVELLIDNEFQPFINKVLLSDFPIDSNNFHTPDLFFSYILNRFSSQLIVIRRGLINAVPRETYLLTLDLNSQSDKNYMISSIYNSTSNIYSPLLISEKSWLVVDNLYFPPNQIECGFDLSGEYNITLSYRSEICEASLVSNYIYSFCDKSIILLYKVYGRDSSDIEVLIGIVVGVFTLIILSIIIWLLVKTKCCTNFSAFKIKKIPISNRAELYIDNEEKKDQDAPLITNIHQPKEIEIINHDNPEIEKKVTPSVFKINKNSPKLIKIDKIGEEENIVIGKKKDINEKKELIFKQNLPEESEFMNTRQLEDVANFTNIAKKSENIEKKIEDDKNFEYYDYKLK